MEHALTYCEGSDGLLFRPWPNIRRDLAAACKRAGIPVVTPNDLRRTYATWWREHGVATADIASLLGHKDSRMVERVYGRMEPIRWGAPYNAGWEPARRLSPQLPPKIAVAHV